MLYAFQIADVGSEILNGEGMETITRTQWESSVFSMVKGD